MTSILGAIFCLFLILLGISAFIIFPILIIEDSKENLLPSLFLIAVGLVVSIIGGINIVTNREYDCNFNQKNGVLTIKTYNHETPVKEVKIENTGKDPDWTWF